MKKYLLVTCFIFLFFLVGCSNRLPGPTDGLPPEHQPGMQYTVPVIFDHLPVNLDILMASWLDNGENQSYFTQKFEPINNLYGNDGIAEIPNPGIGSWFFFRGFRHPEGSRKWYLNSMDPEQKVYAVKDGKITKAVYSSGFVQVDGQDYAKDCLVELEIPKTINNGDHDTIRVWYMHLWINAEIFNDPAVSHNENVPGEGYTVESGEIIGIIGDEDIKWSRGVDFAVLDNDAYHPNLSPRHKYYNFVNPTLFYDGDNLDNFNKNYQTVYNLAVAGGASPFINKNGLGNMGEFNHKNQLWGIWYNRISLENDGINWDYNMAKLYFLSGEDINTETYSMPAEWSGFYVEDCTGNLPGLDYVWEPEIMSGYDTLTFFELVDGTVTSGILRIVSSSIGDKFAKFKVIENDQTRLFDDKLVIKYFNSIDEARSGNLTGSIFEDDNYYEFVRIYSVY